MKTKGYYTTTKCIKTSFLCRFLSFFSIFFPLSEKILWMSSQKCLVLSPFLHVSPTTTPPTAPTKKNDDDDDDDDNDASVTV